MRLQGWPRVGFERFSRLELKVAPKAAEGYGIYRIRILSFVLYDLAKSGGWGVTMSPGKAKSAGAV